MRQERMKLTQSGVCCNPACRSPLYVEWTTAPDHEACFDCGPEQFREGLRPLIAGLFERDAGGAS